MDIKTFNEVSDLVDIKYPWVRSTWSKCMQVCLSERTVKSLTGNDKTGAASKRGIYKFTTTINGKIIVLYIGKAEDSTFDQRWNSHWSAFRNETENESSAWKLEAFMKQNGLDVLLIDIEYIDLSNIKRSLIHFFECESIQLFKPILNK